MLCLPPEDARRKAGFAGKPYPYVDAVRRCPAARTSCSSAGPNVFPGYWRNDEATANAFRDGWLLTGDIAERDDEGYYRILGRLKDMIVSGGENVYPAEIESVLHEHPAVADAAVVGVPDERWGEACAAFVVAEAPVSEDELREHCRERLARFKVPRVVHVRRRAAAQLHGQDPEVRARRCTRDGRRHERRRPAALPAGARHAPSLLDAAEAVFGELGFPEASVVKVAEAAGVATGTFYLYFDSKRAIFVELMTDLNSRIRHAMSEGGGEGDDAPRVASSSASRRSSASPPSIRRSTGSSGSPSSSRRRCSATTTTASPRAT